MALAIILLNKTNRFEKTIQSLLNLSPKQIVIGTYTPINTKWDVIDLKKATNYSTDLNKLIESVRCDWILYVKDTETIIQTDDLSCLDEQAIYSIQILQDDIITKEPRLWHKKNKINFKNPVFEKLNAHSTKFLDVILYQEKISDDNILKILENWKKSAPMAIDPYYYKAFMCLTNKNFKDFKSLISYYLFNSRVNDVSCVIARYYLAMVQSLVENDNDGAIKNIVACLAENPLMAEFWCLLGDIFVKSNEFEKAMAFYQNAILLGGRRLKYDEWPMHISKYDEYPNEMIDKCKKTLNSLIHVSYSSST